MRIIPSWSLKHSNDFKCHIYLQGKSVVKQASGSCRVGDWWLIGIDVISAAWLALRGFIWLEGCDWRSIAWFQVVVFLVKHNMLPINWRKCFKIFTNIYYRSVSNRQSISQVGIIRFQPLMWCRADPRFAPSQWETSLQSNAVSHWLGANLESALLCISWNPVSAAFSWADWVMWRQWCGAGLVNTGPGDVKGGVSSDTMALCTLGSSDGWGVISGFDFYSRI